MSKLYEFLAADYEFQFQILNDPSARSQVREWMGADLFERFLGYRPDTSHLASGPKNIVFVPGVMGSTLQSRGLGGVWWLDLIRGRDQIDQLRLAPDGSCDLDPAAEIVPGAVDISYVPFRRVLANCESFGGSIPFPYDWRLPLQSSVEALKQTVHQTHSECGKPIHLVGHSMGGLLIRLLLMIHGKELWPKIGQIVYLGTPHYGSPSIAGYLKNHLWGTEAIAILGLFLSRETFRSMRGVLSLLPAPAGIYPGTREGQPHPCANFDMYNAKAWELGLDSASINHLQSVLDEVRKLHTDLYEWHASLLQQYRDRMLMVVGVGQETLFRLEFDELLWGLWERARKITKTSRCDPNRDGDGRVPAASAQLEDVTTRYIKGEHGDLPNIPAVAKDVLAWLTGGKLALPETCKGAYTSNLSAEVADGGLFEKEQKGRFRNLPEYESPTPEFREWISVSISQGKMPEINLVKLL